LEKKYDRNKSVILDLRNTMVAATSDQEIATLLDTINVEILTSSNEKYKNDLLVLKQRVYNRKKKPKKIKPTIETKLASER